MCATRTGLVHQTSRLGANDLGRFAQAASLRLTLPDRTFHTTATFAQSGLSEILKTEAEYEKENYEEPEVSCPTTILSDLLAVAICTGRKLLLSPVRYQNKQAFLYLCLPCSSTQLQAEAQDV